MADLGDLADLLAGTGPHEAVSESLARHVALAISEGARRVQAVHAADDAATAWAAARAGLRREGVLRGVPVAPGVPGPGSPTPGAPAVHDLAVVAHVAGDPDAGTDALPAILPLLPTSLLAAGLVLRDGAGRVLLLRTSYKEPWEVPGGLVEDGEGLRAAAAREAREELGLDLAPGRLLVLDRRSGDGRQGERALALLDGGVHDVDLPARCRFLDGEVLEAAWCTPAEVRARTGAGLAQRVEAALDRLETGEQSAALLADGRPETA
ncbi:NUDIX domain-containing protein [uncultured Pseudokineococcus sp.]|uniref:NUDIX domain-containing protein n=1 Tax=uncultured Pseudokineococcus sp. TaxID=1642928 RepID=UPI002623941C|nr:NUDIX hydrolase [uncultured Pseudokineococcus sp.]